MSDFHQRIANLSPEKRRLLELRLKKKSVSIVNEQTIPRREVSGPCPLSFAQQRLWFLHQFKPDIPVYNMPKVVKISGALNVKALRRTLDAIVARHEALRTTFAIVDGEPMQVIAKSWSVELPVIDLSDWPDGERGLQRLLDKEIQRPFDLSHDLMIRSALFRLSDEEHILLLVIHHIASDYWSFGVLYRELAAFYEAFSIGRPSPLPDLPIQYTDFAIWQRERLQGERLEASLSYWKQRLDDAPSMLELPADHPRPLSQTYQGARKSLVLSKSLTKALKTLSQQEEVTLFMTLLAAFKMLLYRYTGQDDVVIGTPIAGRNRPEIEGLIGFFLNSLVLRTNLSGNPTFLELLGRVREVALGAYVHQDVPFEKLLEELQPERDLSRTPLFQIFFNMLNPLDTSTIKLSGLKVESYSRSSVHSNFDLTLYVKEEREEIHLYLVYNTDLFSKDRIIESLEQYKHLLFQIVEQPEERIDRFSLVTLTAQGILPDPTEVLDSTWEGAIHALFSQQAHRVPEQFAVVDPHDAWSYKELDARGNQLANYLITSGIQPQDIVAIYGHRSASLVWALLGVLKAGAAFLILDPTYPASRLTDYLRMAKPRSWIQMEAAGELPGALEKFVATLSCCCRLVLPQRSMTEERGLLMDYSSEDPGVAVGPDDLAYVAFTSGSTGKPKGILGRHGSLTHFMPWQKEFFGLDQSDRFSMLSGLSHDPLQRDIFTPLWLGATICIPDADIIGTPGRLADWMTQKQITFAHLTPAMGQILAETAAPDCRIPSLRYAFFVGDKLTRRDVARLRRLAPEVTCINSYGSTETQRAVGYYIIPPEPETEENRAKAVYPLGRGISDVQLLVLNAEQQLAGVGEIGEIYVRSPHLAQGYLENEALTQARFLANPFTGVNGDRLYKTGDLGRYLPDGNVEFLGRADHQVKIRGYRIELGEVEAMLGQHPTVRETVVLAREDVPGDKRLVAYVVSNQGQTPTTSELRSFLKQKLPDYMMPSTFVTLDALPLTPNGKVDRRALPAPDTVRPELEETFVAPRDELELQLTKIWEQVLGIQPIGVRDNFFDLGGHSLLAVRLFAQIEKITGKKLPLAALFQSPTIEQLAIILRQEEWSAPWTSLVPIQPGGSKPPFFCVHGHSGQVLFCRDLAHHLGPDQPFYGFQRQGLDGKQPYHTRIEDMAAHYVKEMQALQPEGPYFLGGFCLGGTVAFEIAQQLHAQGQKVDLLVLLDAANFKGQPSISFAQRIGLHLNNFLQLGFKEKLTYVLHKGRAVTQTIRRRIENRSQTPSAGQIVTITPSPTESYTPQVYPGRMTVFRSIDQPALYYRDPYLGWDGLAAGGIESHEIPAEAGNLMKEPYVQVLAEKLRACLDEAQTDDLDIT